MNWRVSLLRVIPQGVTNCESIALELWSDGGLEIQHSISPRLQYSESEKPQNMVAQVIAGGGKKMGWVIIFPLAASCWPEDCSVIFSVGSASFYYFSGHESGEKRRQI